jgi:hypothetical protein
MQKLGQSEHLNSPSAKAFIALTRKLRLFFNLFFDGFLVLVKNCPRICSGKKNPKLWLLHRADVCIFYFLNGGY